MQTLPPRGYALGLKGSRCDTGKCAMEKRNTPPGGGPQKGSRRRVSDYGLQLREKQKLRRTYGVLERQFRGYFEEAERRTGITGETLLQLLERRLDNVVYRLSMAASRAQARLLVGQGHFAVNGRRVTIPSYLVQVGEVVSVGGASRNTAARRRGDFESRVAALAVVAPDRGRCHERPCHRAARPRGNRYSGPRGTGGRVLLPLAQQQGGQFTMILIL